MKRVLITLFAVLSFAVVALASSLPQSGTVVVTDDNGVQVGSGTIGGGTLSLTLHSGTSGFATFTVTSSSGATESFQAMIDAKGQITVVHDSSFEDLAAFAKSSSIDKVEVSETPESSASGSDSSSKDSTTAEDPSGDSKDSSTAEDTSGDSSTKESGDSIDVGHSVGGSSSTDTSTDTHDSSDD